MKTDFYLIWFYGEISLDYQEQVEIKKQLESLLHKMFNNIVYTYIYYYNGNLEVYVLTITPTAWCDVLNLGQTTSDTNIFDKIIHWINTSNKKVKCIGKTKYRSKL
jgi:hypothetical protein